MVGRGNDWNTSSVLAMEKTVWLVWAQSSSWAGPLDRIVHAEVWATDTIPADLPPMVEFKAKADKIIKERWGIEVEHIKSKYTFESGFYTLVGQRAKPEYRGKPRGWAGTVIGNWCNRDLKQPAFRAANRQNGVYYIGNCRRRAEPLSQSDRDKEKPLVEAGWTEAMCPPVVRGQRLTISHIHHRNPWRLLVLPQPGRGTAPASAKELPRAVGVDAQMGQRQPGHV